CLQGLPGLTREIPSHMPFAPREFFEEPGVINDPTGAHETDPRSTVLYAARAQVVTPHQPPGVPELSKLQSAGASPEEAAARARVLPRSVTSRYWKRTKLIACRV